MEKKVIRPFYHEHPLILKENVSKEERVDCYGCGKVVADFEMAYVCIELHCSFRIILHKKCGEVPSQIRHPKHPNHPIHLYDFHNKNHSCNLCRRSLYKELGYRCSSCDFDFEIACEKIGIDALLEERKELKHPSHLDHPLTLMRKPAFPFYCDGCGAQDVDMAYICSTCEFMVHKSCASFPTILPIDDQYHHHHHPLSLVFSFPKEHLKYYSFFKCEVCDKRFDSTCWGYFCGDCRYFVHIKCVGSTTKPDSNLKEDDDGGGSNTLPNTLHPSSSSNSHLVQLYGDCQNIPNKKHNFTLHAPSKSKGRDAISFWLCNLCDFFTNGMGYKCEECGMKIDVRCASLPTSQQTSTPH